MRANDSVACSQSGLVAEEALLQIAAAAVVVSVSGCYQVLVLRTSMLRLSFLFFAARLDLELPTKIVLYYSSSTLSDGISIEFLT